MDLRFTISDMNTLTFDLLPGEILNYLNDLEKLCVRRFLSSPFQDYSNTNTSAV